VGWILKGMLAQPTFHLHRTLFSPLSSFSFSAFSFSCVSFSSAFSSSAAFVSFASLSFFSLLLPFLLFFVCLLLLSVSLFLA